ncbi:hypothetical protein [Exiguobacterium sp. s129]|uniref:hypothetical protein n=1 Tax=Exiguobacterium sp. s129 TaxID=2751264 RepID=UPI001BEB88CD|nr:hypothetical protein [Exiguobacterium sp. s129]
MNDITMLLVLLFGLTLGVIISTYQMIRTKKQRPFPFILNTGLTVSGYMLLIGSLTFGYGWGALWWAVVGLAMNVFGLIVHLFLISYHLLKKRRVRS